MQAPINQETEHAEIPQTQNIDKIGDKLVSMQRQVPGIQTVLKTRKAPQVQLGSVCTKRSLMFQRPMLRSRSASRSVRTNRSLTFQRLKKMKESVERRGIVREHKAMQENVFLSNWLSEDVVGTERRKDREQKVREEESRSGCKREEEQRTT